MNNLKQLFMVGVIALCATGMTQAVAAAYGGPVVAGGVIITNDHNDGADPRGSGSDDSGSGSGEGGAGGGSGGSSEGGNTIGSGGGSTGGSSGGSSGSGSNTITFGNSPGMVSGGTMSNTAGTNSGVGSVAQEVTISNPY